MKKWSILLTVLVVTACLFQACKKSDVEEYPMDKITFVTQASSSYNLGIRAGNSASEKAVSQDVKDYASLSIADNTAADSVLVALATSKGIPISSNLISVHQSNFNILNSFAGTNFDQAFAELMVLTLDETVFLFETAALNVNDAELRQYAAARIPDLRVQLQEARALNVAVNQ